METGHTTHGGLVTQVEPGSLAARLGVQPDDVLLAVNGVEVDDVIDVQYYAAEYQVELTLWRDGEQITLSGERGEGEPLGLDFAHPTFDTDIRRCNNKCEFCFVTQSPPGMRRTVYIKDDDYRYSFLFGHFVTLTNLDDEDWGRIEEQHLSPLYVSVHATQLELRRRALANKNAPDVLEVAKKSVHAFRIEMVVNMARNPKEESFGQVIGEVCRRYLEIDMHTLGSVPYDPTIERWAMRMEHGSFGHEGTDGALRATYDIAYEILTRGERLTDLAA